MTTYRMIHKNMNCPICNKPLIESEHYDEVACSNPRCKFNNIKEVIKNESKFRVY